MERELLNLLFLDRKSWEAAKDKLVEADFSPHGWILLQHISTYYETDANAQACSPEIIVARLKRTYPKSEVFVNLIGSFGDKVSTPNVLKELYDFKRHGVKQKLATRLLDNKREDAEAITQLFEEYYAYSDYNVDAESDTEDSPVVAPRVADVIHNLTSDDAVIKLYPKSLNEAVGGGVPRQSHIILYGSPEIGKSAVVINQAVMSARDGWRVLLFDNEDPRDATWARIQSRITGMTKAEMRNDVEKAQELLDTCGFYDRIIVLSKSPGTIAELDGLCEEYNPDLLIVNQIRHLHFKGAEGDVAQLTAAGRGMRGLIKRHNIVGISVTQAADSARGKGVLDIGDVYMSNVSLPGDADILLGIGATPDMMLSGMRMFSLAKNKLNGNHEPVAVEFNEQLSKFRSL